MSVHRAFVTKRRNRLSDVRHIPPGAEAARMSLFLADAAEKGKRRETNYRTEFVAVLSNYPQGGFATRELTGDILPATDNFWDRGYEPMSGIKHISE